MIDQRGRPTTPGPARANTTVRRLVSTREKLEMGDVEASGDLVEPGRFVVYGWKTNGEDDPGVRLVVDTPAQAGDALAGLLRSGHVQFSACKLDERDLVAYPQITS